MLSQFGITQGCAPGCSWQPSSRKGIHPCRATRGCQIVHEGSVPPPEKVAHGSFRGATLLVRISRSRNDPLRRLTTTQLSKPAELKSQATLHIEQMGHKVQAGQAVLDRQFLPLVDKCATFGISLGRKMTKIGRPFIANSARLRMLSAARENVVDGLPALDRFVRQEYGGGPHTTLLSRFDWPSRDRTGNRAFPKRLPR